MADIVDRLTAEMEYEADGLCADARAEIVRLRKQLDAARTGKALLALEAAQAEIERLIPFARLIAQAEPYDDTMDPDETLWDRVHPTVREADDARAAVAAYNAARKGQP